ncbi:MAG: hypothetical protein SO016_06545 [Lachnospiraceae bacterium]|nr:hypothetical protein [Lachnospiraceae bacterium]
MVSKIAALPYIAGEDDVLVDKAEMYGIRTNQPVFMDYQRDQKDSLFKPQKRLDEILEENKEIKTDLIVARKKAGKSNCS